MSDTQRPLTGRKVLIIAVCAFGVILAANLAMLFAATGTFPGLVVKNSYVASQEFDTRRAAQMALGWTSQAVFRNGRLNLSLTGPDGNAAQPETLSAIVGRPTVDRDDQALKLVADGGGWSADVELDPGRWRLEITATAIDGTAFAQTLLIEVKEAQ